MTLIDVLKWNRRLSAVYAVGVWTMIGSYAFFKYTGRYDEDTPASVSKEESQEPDDPYKVVYQTPHSKTTIIYKKDFVPYTTRIYNFIKSFSGESGTGDK